MPLSSPPFPRMNRRRRNQPNSPSMIADRDRALSFLKRRSFIKMVEIIDFFPSFGYNRITASNQTTVLCAASDPISGESMRIVFVWIFDRSCTAYNKIPFFKLFPSYMTAARSASALFCCIGIYKLYKKRFYMSHSICARPFLRLLLLGALLLNSSLIRLLRYYPHQFSGKRQRNNIRQRSAGFTESTKSKAGGYPQRG